MKPVPRKLGVSFVRSRLQVAEIEHGKKVNLTVLAESTTSVDLRQTGASLTPSHPQVTTLAGEIRELLEANKIRAQSISFALPPDSVFVNIVPLPKTLKGPKLEEHLHWELSHYIPDFDPQNFLLESTPIAHQPEHAVNVIVLSLKRGMVGFLQKVSAELRLRLSTLNIDHFCSEKTLAFNYPEIQGHTVLLISTRYGAVDASALKDGELVDYRRFLGQMPVDVPQIAGAYLKYINQRDDMDEPSAMFFSGLELPIGVMNRLKKEIPVQTITMNAFRKLPIKGKVFEQYLNENYRFSAAIGLALRNR